MSKLASFSSTGTRSRRLLRRASAVAVFQLSCLVVAASSEAGEASELTSAPWMEVPLETSEDGENPSIAAPGGQNESWGLGISTSFSELNIWPMLNVRYTSPKNLTFEGDITAFLIALDTATALLFDTSDYHVGGDVMGGYVLPRMFKVRPFAVAGGLVNKVPDGTITGIPVGIGLRWEKASLRLTYDLISSGPEAMAGKGSIFFAWEWF